MDRSLKAAQWIKVRNPETGELISEVRKSTEADIDSALERGLKAFKQGALPAYERSRILAEVALRVKGDAERFARIIATEGIKTIREARSEVARCAITLELSAEEAKRVGGETIPMDQSAAGHGKVALTTRVPSGLIVAITPFNDPLNLVAHKIGPALAVGAPVILKPHPQTPLSAIALCELFYEAGLAKNMLQLVHGGAQAGARLVSDDRPRIISFTGGAQAGQAIAQAAGFKKCLMELGGVGSVLVCADADLEKAVASIQVAAFAAAGQNCLHAQRIIVEESIAPLFTEMILERTRSMNLGNKLDDGTDMGCCIDENAARRIVELIAESKARGGEVLMGGTVQGARIAPTWIRVDEADNPLAQNEVFGPVSVIETAKGPKEMLAKLCEANPSLHVAVFTDSMEMAMAVYETAQAAAVLVNESTDFRIDAMPFGGSGSAGMGREGVRFSIDEMSETRMLVFQRKSA